MQPNSLLLYKNRPARILSVSQKLEIITDEGKTVHVREKDVALLHPGPIHNFAELVTPSGDVETAWELLTGSENLPLEELAELVFGEFTPATAWGMWELIRDDPHFKGTPYQARGVSAEELTEAIVKRRRKEEERLAWTEFWGRLQARLAGREEAFLPADTPFLAEIEALATQQTTSCRTLAELKRGETRENAHALLLEIGHWQPTFNPYPLRQGVFLSEPTAPLPALSDTPRHDLTHLPAFAIDDAGSNDPDDAISLDGNRLWVHVADASALVQPDTPADWEARARGANIYLPERVVTMLPDQARTQLALGLQPISPALSIGIDLTESGEIDDVTIVHTQIHVTRLTYEAVEARITEAPFAAFYAIAKRSLAKRIANGSVEIDLPETRVRVNDTGEIKVRQIEPLASRQLVQEGMLLAGEAVAIYAQKHEIPIPFSSQSPPRDGADKLPDGIAGMFGLRRLMRASQRKTVPMAHAGLGLPAYVQATSPLRRYLDLVVHQQLSAHLQGKGLLTEQEVIGRIGAFEGIAGNVVRASRLSDQHWTILYLLQTPDWRGEGVVVEKQSNRNVLLVPMLALETTLHSPYPIGIK